MSGIKMKEEVREKAFVSFICFQIIRALSVDFSKLSVLQPSTQYPESFLCKKSNKFEL